MNANDHEDIENVIADDAPRAGRRAMVPDIVACR
jgi:hypothetical protein